MVMKLRRHFLMKKNINLLLTYYAKMVIHLMPLEMHSNMETCINAPNT